MGVGHALNCCLVVLLLALPVLASAGSTIAVAAGARESAPEDRATALGRTGPGPRSSPGKRTGGILPGVDVWRRRGFSPLAGRRIGLLTNRTGRDAEGRLTARVLAAADRVDLVRLFSPEHGLAGEVEGPVDDGRDPLTGLPIVSLYGDRRRPSPGDLEGLEGLVVDLQDIGTRFYTYATTMAYLMEEAAVSGIPVVVLDRPNPIGGRIVEGPVLEPELRSFNGYARLPLRHGMTMGELARLFREEAAIEVELTVVPMRGWSRDDWFDATGLLWIEPSPNIRSPTQALLYPAVGPLERTDVSVGRGTDAPFEWLGAPWIDSMELAWRLNDADLPGIRFVPARRTPRSSVHADVPCGGVVLVLTDRDRFAAARTAVELARALHDLYPERWDAGRMVDLWGDRRLPAQLETGRSTDAIVASWQEELDAFRERRSRHLIYD